jgi:thiamine biosynthesis lipoprotein
MTVSTAQEFDALGVRVRVLVEDPDALEQAVGIVRDHLADVDRTCSRFRDDSELQRLSRGSGEPTKVSALLADALDHALDAARWTDGIVDPCLGDRMVELGYDRDFVQVTTSTTTSTTTTPPAATSTRALTLHRRVRWSDVEWSREARMITLPPGCSLDLGATAKAWAADTCADLVHEATGTQVLVGLGGDLATRGVPAEGGWTVRLLETLTDDIDGAGVVRIGVGGMATSGTRARRWTHGGSTMHHILDPSTGAPSTSTWRTVTVWAPTCFEANVLSTAAIASPRHGFDLLRRSGRAARAVGVDGAVVQLNSWPSEVAS